jgi:hypothetical protein
MKQWESLLTHRTDLANEIRAFCKSQVSLWQRVPRLQLEVEGRDGGMRPQFQYQIIDFTSWMITKGMTGPDVMRTFVDCTTGELYRFDHVLRGPALEVDARVIALLDYLEEVDAAKVIQTLEAKIARPRPSWVSEQEEAARAEMRTRIAARLRLPPIYVGDPVSA